MTATTPSVDGLYVGASGWSYPSWRPHFYPDATRPVDFLRHYASRLPTVELNTTGYRLPSEEQFQRWAEQTPPHFRFAVKMPQRGLRDLATFQERVEHLGSRLGPIRVVLPSARDEGLLELLLGSLDGALEVAFDFRHDSCDGVDARLSAAGVVRVGAWDADAPFRYLRFREPPYAHDELERIATRVEDLVTRGVRVYAYFRHENEPTAPRYAERLLALVAEPRG